MSLNLNIGVRLAGVDPSVVDALTLGVLRALRASYEQESTSEGVVLTAGEELTAAATALTAAAEGLKGAGRGLQANAAIHAARRAAQAAEGVLGG